ncbi:hypothetical protein ACOSP7_018714 [Xanthoceras sorbifolium]
MESDEKVELINQTIQKLIEEKKKKKKSSKDASSHDDQLILSTLLSQLESLKEEEVPKQSSENETTKVEEITCPSVGEVEANGKDGGGAEIGTEGIVNELRKVRRQNLITHCLLSVMIVLTVAWQLSEVKLILKVKDGLNHPLRSVGSMLTGMLKGPQNNGKDAEKQHGMEELKMPELPHMDLSELHLNGERH